MVTGTGVAVSGGSTVKVLMPVGVATSVAVEAVASAPEAASATSAGVLTDETGAMTATAVGSVASIETLTFG